MSTDIKTRQLEIITAAGYIMAESGISGLTTKNHSPRFVAENEIDLFRVPRTMAT